MAQQNAGIHLVSSLVNLLLNMFFKLELARLDSLMLLSKEAFMVNQ